MSHRSVVSLFENAAKSLSDNIQFGYGRRSDFNQNPDISYPYIWLLPLTANPAYVVNDAENYQKTWNCILVFLKADKTDSLETEYKPILDEMDELVDKFINRVNDWSLNSEDVVGQVTIRGISQNWIIKGDADVFTGWFVSFQLVVSDNFEYCTPDNIKLYDN